MVIRYRKRRIASTEDEGGLRLAACRCEDFVINRASDDRRFATAAKIPRTSALDSFLRKPEKVANANVSQ